MISEIIFHKNILRTICRLFFWHTRFYLSKPVLPLACGFYITSKCNLRCEFCNIWRIKPGFQTPLDKSQKLITELGKIGLIYLSFSGGEPLLVPYIFDLLSSAKKSGILYTHLVSNGYLMDKDTAKKLAEVCVSEISFSLDGDEETHDKMRGMKGSFQKVIEAIVNVKIYAPKTRIVLNTVLDPVNPENAVAALKTAEKLKVKIKFQPANNHPSFGTQNCATKFRDNLQDTEKQALIKTINLIQKSSYLDNSQPFLKNYLFFLFNPEKLLLADDDCIFGYHHLEFFANQLFPCLEGLGWKDGTDFADESLKTILDSKSYFDKLQLLKKCKNCQKNYYVCYYEPRLNFPIYNFVSSRLKT